MALNLIGIFVGILSITGGIISRNSYKRMALNYRYANVKLEGLKAYTNVSGNMALIFGIIFILMNFFNMYSHIPSYIGLIISVTGLIIMIIMFVRLIKIVKKFNIPWP